MKLHFKNIHKNGTTNIRLHKDTNKIKIAKGVRQWDTIPAKLYIYPYSDERKRNKHRRGIFEPSDVRPRHLYYYYWNISRTTLNNLNRKSIKIGLKMNKINKSNVKQRNTSPKNIRIHFNLLVYFFFQICSLNIFLQIVFTILYFFKN